MRRKLMLPVIVTACWLAAMAAGQGANQGKTLDIYVVDVEGGNATLFVAPGGESLLIDTGNAGSQAVRDAGRIVEAVKAAGLDHIDHLIITHWHGDHFGGLAEFVKQVPVREFIDHGPNVQPGELADNFLRDTYPKIIANAKHTVAKPGDKIALGGVGVTVVAYARGHGTAEYAAPEIADGGRYTPASDVYAFGVLM